MEPVIEKLKQILTDDPGLQVALQKALQKAARPGVDSMEKFYQFLQSICTEMPGEKDLMPTVREFYFIISQAPENTLKLNKTFADWVQEFVETRGAFMDSTRSASTLETFIKDPKYCIEDYVLGPSGWLTYNQFLGRQVKPGKRPVAGLCNDNIIASPTDGEYKGSWPISETSSVTAKGVQYPVAGLLQGSAYAEVFKEGLFTHTFLSISDYHRYHTPVSGRVAEIRKMPGNTWITEAVKEDCSIENIDDIGFQFTHTRGCLILESAIGYVALIPVGMGHISSVNFIVDEEDQLVKGSDIGFFAFGGSDFITLFQHNRAELDAVSGNHYLQGEAIGRGIS